jgi:hypothetical protein
MSDEQQNIARLLEQGSAVRETLAGYARAAAVTERERMERLARMTDQEAHAIYDDLCQSSSAQRDTQDLERLERWRLETLLAVREAMARLSRRESGE